MVNTKYNTQRPYAAKCTELPQGEAKQKKDRTIQHPEQPTQTSSDKTWTKTEIRSNHANWNQTRKIADQPDGDF